VRLAQRLDRGVVALPLGEELAQREVRGGVRRLELDRRPKLLLGLVEVAPTAAGRRRPGTASRG